MTESEAIEKLNMLNDALNWQRADADKCSEALQMAIKALEENQQYKALGTVEELRIAKEKQIPKKPILANNMMTKDKFLMCPCCKFRFPDSLVFLKTRCWNCGQKLDWSDEE